MAAFPTIATPSLAHPWLPAAWPRLTAPGLRLESAVPPPGHPALPGGETPRQRRPGVVLLEQQDLAASPGPSASRLPPATQARGANRLSSIWSAWAPPAPASPPAPLRPASPLSALYQINLAVPITASNGCPANLHRPLGKRQEKKSRAGTGSGASEQSETFCNLPPSCEFAPKAAREWYI